MNTKGRCTDPDAGRYLHGYELGLLSEAEKEAFETHLLTCECCIQSLQQGEAAAYALLKDKTVAAFLSSVSSDEEHEKGEVPRWRRILWPSRHLVLRPLFLYVLIILLAIPAVRSFIGDDPADIRQIKTYYLTNNRNTPDSFVPGDAEKEIILSFHVDSYMPDRRYSVLITDTEGTQVTWIESFTSIDTYGVGNILIPLTSLQSGTYHVKIHSYPENRHTPEDSLIFQFDITTDVR
jgi:hypothetical protein